MGGGAGGGSVSFVQIWDKAKQEFQKAQQEYFSKIDGTPL